MPRSETSLALHWEPCIVELHFDCVERDAITEIIRASRAPSDSEERHEITETLPAARIGTSPIFAD